MSKTLNEFKDISSKIDVYFLLLDARAPKSSFIDSFQELIKDKKVVVILTKADLVNKKELQKWVDYYKDKYNNAYPMTLTNRKQVRKEIINILDSMKFKNLLPKISIIGAPNVGKSTLLNVLAEGKKASAEDRAGVTKKIAWYQISKKYWVQDTPGVLQPKFHDEEQGLKLAAIGSIKIDVLPLEDVVLNLLKLLREKNIDIPFDEDIEKDLHIKEEESKLETKDYYKKIIKDFQTGKFGKVILD